MTKNPIIYILFIIIYSVPLIAQSSELYIPVEIQRAYKNQTRSMTGEPGEKYFQNKSAYKISVKVDPAERKVSGSAIITYHNQSPDSLRQLVVRLYQNINRPGAQRDFSLDTLALHEGMQIHHLVIGKDTLDPQDRIALTYSGTVLIVDLKSKIAPKDSIEINIKWHFTVPNTDQVRMGAYSETDFMIAYWYPQIAVYDDIYGWDKIEYTGQAEFYNDFSEYDVQIDVPADYSVWATGILQNKEELFNDKYLERYNRAMNSEEVIKIIAPGDKNIYRNKNRLLWHYKASYVPDFAFAISNHYLWDGVSASAGTPDNRRVFVSAAYNPLSKDFYEVALLSKQIIESLSKDFPAIPFPYPSLTVFNGGGGMEYPMMVNDASSGERWGTVHLTAHEISHTYFPFYMGTNETRFAWMDEGWAVMLPAQIQAELSPGYKPDERNTNNYLQYAGSYQDIPPMVVSFVLNGNMYRSPSYNRAGAAYRFLKDFLGEEKFNKAMKEYVSAWNGKHPMPYDFFFCFNRAAGEDLSWFWKPWFFEHAYPDLSVTRVKIEGTRLKFLVKRNGALPIPVSAKIHHTNGKTSRVYRTAGIWSSGLQEVWIETNYAEPVEYVSLEDPAIPDIDHTNNFTKFGN